MKDKYITVTNGKKQRVINLSKNDKQGINIGTSNVDPTRYSAKSQQHSKLYRMVPQIIKTFNENQKIKEYRERVKKSEKKIQKKHGVDEKKYQKQTKQKSKEYQQKLKEITDLLEAGKLDSSKFDLKQEELHQKYFPQSNETLPSGQGSPVELNDTGKKAVKQLDKIIDSSQDVVEKLKLKKQEIESDLKQENENVNEQPEKELEYKKIQEEIKELKKSGSSFGTAESINDLEKRKQEIKSELNELHNTSRKTKLEKELKQTQNELVNAENLQTKTELQKLNITGTPVDSAFTKNAVTPNIDDAKAHTNRGGEKTNATGRSTDSLTGSLPDETISRRNDSKESYEQGIYGEPAIIFPEGYQEKRKDPYTDEYTSKLSDYARNNLMKKLAESPQIYTDGYIDPITNPEHQINGIGALISLRAERMGKE